MSFSDNLGVYIGLGAPSFGDVCFWNDPKALALGVFPKILAVGDLSEAPRLGGLVKIFWEAGIVFLDRSPPVLLNDWELVNKACEEPPNIEVCGFVSFSSFFWVEIEGGCWDDYF